MKLLRLGIEGFGSLRGEHHFDPDKLTLVVDENERGKSTLLAAISAALYGLSDDRRHHRPVTPLERWRPWDGGPFGLELEFECASQRYVVRRDFANGTVHVRDAAGAEVTAKFLDGKDEYPVGKLLLGLDLEEFEKCSFVRQEDLAEVVPLDEKDRRTNSLQAKLERAADTRAGNSSAAEALRVLDEAATRYTEPLLDTTIKVENAIQRMNAKVLELDTEIHSLEHDFSSIQEPLERLAAIEEEERRLESRDLALNSERRAALRSEAQAKLDQHRGALAEIARLEVETARLAPHAAVPHDTDARFHEVAARLEELERQEQRLTQVRQDLESQRAEVDREIDGLAAFAALDESHADKFVAHAAELRRLDHEREEARGERARTASALATRGFDAATIERLDRRFGALGAEPRGLLEVQPRLALELQAETADAEAARDDARTRLREVADARKKLAIPGIVLLALGAAGAGLAAAQYVLAPLVVAWELLAAIAGGVLAIGVALVAVAAGMRRDARQDAQADLAAATDRLDTLAIRRESNERQMQAIAESTGCADSGDLARSFAEYLELERERGSHDAAVRKLDELDAARAAVLDQAGNPPDAAFLDRAASGIRTRVARGRQRVDLATRLDAVAADLQRLQAQRAEHAAAADAILSAAGIARDAGQPWSAHARDVTTRTDAARRHQTLVEEHVPRARRDVLHHDIVRHLEQLLEMLDRDDAEAAAIGATPPAAAPRSLAEIERETSETRARLDALRRERGELRLRVEDVAKRYHHHHPERLIEREAFEKALARARRFKASVDLARATISQVALETHRRWSEFLNARVGQVLQWVGTGVDQVRFGEDLDFAVQPRKGQPIARGKAVRHLSSGARDQVHLAVRLAISEYLSREESLPILIDDCFATSDDERARAGMRLLIEQFTPNHQVIVVTCHRRRFEAIAGQEGDLYPHRVHWIDTRHMRAAEAHHNV